MRDEGRDDRDYKGDGDDDDEGSAPPSSSGLASASLESEDEDMGNEVWGQRKAGKTPGAL